MRRVANDFIKMAVTNRENFMSTTGACRGLWEPELHHYVVRHYSNKQGVTLYLFFEENSTWYGPSQCVAPKYGKLAEPWGAEVHRVPYRTLEFMRQFGVAEAVKRQFQLSINGANR